MTDKKYSRWPYSLEPFFVIETCQNCAEHQFCTRHVPGFYHSKALYLKECIQKLVPELNPAQNNSLNPNDTPI